MSNSKPITSPCFDPEYIRRSVARFINEQRESVARDTSLISRKDKEAKQEDDDHEQ